MLLDQVLLEQMLFFLMCVIVHFLDVSFDVDLQYVCSLFTFDMCSMKN